MIRKGIKVSLWVKLSPNAVKRCQNNGWRYSSAMRAWMKWRSDPWNSLSLTYTLNWSKEVMSWGHHLISVNPSDRVEFDQNFEMNCYRFSKFIELVYKGE